MPFVVIPRTVRAPISAMRYCRNGLFPDANLQRELVTQVNQGLALRSREVFRSSGFPVAPASASGSGGISGGGATTRARWRFAFTTSTMHKQLRVVFVLAPPAIGTAAGQLVVSDTSPSVVGTATAVYNLGGSGSLSDVPANFQVQSIVLTGTAANATYTGLFQDLGKGRMVSVVVYEESLDATVANGYLWPSGAVGQPIAADDRWRASVFADSKWVTGNQLWNVSTNSDAGAQNTIIGTPQNLFDGTTSPNGASVEAILNLAAHATVTQTSGVPATMMVYGLRNSATGASGKVQLRDSTGAVKLDTGAAFTTVASWVSCTGFLPAVDGAKYDLYFNAGLSSDITIYAVSLFELG